MESEDLEIVRDLWELAPCALHSLGADGVLTRVNDTWLRWLGYTREEVEGRLHFGDILTEESRATFRASFPEFRARGRIENLEFVMRRRDGSTFMALLSATAVQGPGGELLRSRSCFVDITARKQAEQGLLGLVDAAPDATVIVDASGTIKRVNRQVERLFGYTAAELVGGPVEVLMSERLREGHVGHRARFMAAPQARRMGATLDLHGQRKDGSEFPIEINLSPIESPDGLLVAAAIRDVSERRLAELATSRFAAIVDFSDDAILSKTLEGIITSWNGAAERIYGYTADEAIGRSIAMLIPEDKVEEEIQLRELLMAGEPVEHFETVRLRKDGSRIELSVSMSAIRDRRGVIVGASNVARDFSGRRQAQAAARLASERLSDAIECIDDAFAIFGPEGRLVMHNSAYRALFIGREEGPLGGREVGALVAALSAEDEASTSGGDWQVARFAAEDRPTLVHEVRVAGRAYRETMRRTREGGVVLMISDRTADDQREETLRKASTAKSDFLSSMSHELRTPLNAILGFGQLLQRDKRTPLSPRQLGMVDHVVKGGEHLLHLIDEILDLARIEAGRVSISLETVDVGEVLTQSLTTLAPMAERHEITLRVEGTLEGRPKVLADRTRLAQILMNFGSNAIKYSPQGSTATFVVDTQASGRTRVTVVDTGIGIGEEEQALIFQPFYRGAQEASAIEGTGIGLAITRRLAELMGASVGFDSVLGRGSRFWVELPQANARAPVRAVPAPDTQSRFALAGYECSIVYIEDHPANIAFMRELLSNIPGIELITAPTAEIGIELVRVHLPRVVILDINLPGMNGIQALRTLRSWPETRHIPAIGLSAAAMEHDLQRAQSEGFYRYLTKPVRVNELLETLEALLETPAPETAETAS